ncbi:MAPEG family protein [Chitinivorax sp. PXF-14]|uniref:MAPEG family protein n=1 Tax=Chitinivorax sp. PXF-14 TaxID=3230488 RepID=UPI00346505CB
MSATLVALLGYVLWTMLLLFVVINWRGMQVMFGGKRIDAFPADQPHGGPIWYRRLLRAHMNSLETLPLFAVVALTAAVTGASA